MSPRVMAGTDSLNIFIPRTILPPFFDFQASDIHPGSDPTKPHATMVVKNHSLTVIRCVDSSDVPTLPSNKPGGKSPLSCTSAQHALVFSGVPSFPSGISAPSKPLLIKKRPASALRRSNYATSFLTKEFCTPRVGNFTPFFNLRSMSVAAILLTLCIMASLSFSLGAPRKTTGRMSAVAQRLRAGSSIIMAKG